MCNLQSNLKLNKREKKKERKGEQGKRETQMKEGTQHTREWKERVLSIYTHGGIPPGSLQDLFSHCLQKWGIGREEQGGMRGGRGRKERQHNAHEDRETLSSSLHPFADAFRSHRNLGCFSLFLASRACENSSVQDAIRARGVVEDVQETSYRANYLKLTTLPVRSAQNSPRPPQNRFVPTIYGRIQRRVMT